MGSVKRVAYRIARPPPGAGSGNCQEARGRGAGGTGQGVSQDDEERQAVRKVAVSREYRA